MARRTPSQTMGLLVIISIFGIYFSYFYGKLLSKLLDALREKKTSGWKCIMGERKKGKGDMNKQEQKNRRCVLKW
jgi:hypothetical protein